MNTKRIACILKFYLNCVSDTEIAIFVCCYFKNCISIFSHKMPLAIIVTSEKRVDPH